MSKIKLKVSLVHDNNTIISNDYNGIIIDDIIKYKDEQASNILDLNKNILKRSNNEYHIVLGFNEKKGIYDYQNMQIPIELKNIKINNTQNIYHVKYELIMSEEYIGHFTFTVNYEVK